MNVIQRTRLFNSLCRAFVISSDNAYFIEGSNINDKESFLTEFYKKLGAPNYVGFNWDAFSDFLTKELLDQYNITNQGILIIFNNSYHFRKINQGDWKIASDVIFDAMEFWKKDNKKFFVVFL